jgi:hypothetical protein
MSSYALHQIMSIRSELQFCGDHTEAIVWQNETTPTGYAYIVERYGELNMDNT